MFENGTSLDGVWEIVREQFVARLNKIYCQYLCEASDTSGASGLGPRLSSTVPPAASMLSPSNPILAESPVSITSPSTLIRDILESVYLGYLSGREG
ncbi:hypothetical protein PM082_012072 [Marasmius tenuissimus]|nr:hypothetical protein PM082_012072 [Marasmius tenuissimus]